MNFEKTFLSLEKWDFFILSPVEENVGETFLFIFSPQYA